VINPDGQFLIADRRAEHVACVGGGRVLSAGEMWLAVAAGRAGVVEVSNQSTGFCPEPESWPAVAAALDRTGVPHPERFTTEITFRRYPVCRERNFGKNGRSACGVCGADLPAVWNF
jgi:hypothetical protein